MGKTERCVSGMEGWRRGSAGGGVEGGRVGRGGRQVGGGGLTVEGWGEGGIRGLPTS
jgi:hypothetical protein